MAARILVVDHDRELVRLVRTYLEEGGYEVLVAYDGETALHLLRREHPDLMLLDLMLPGRRAVDLARATRGDVDLAALPIITLDARVEGPGQIADLTRRGDDGPGESFDPGEIVGRVQLVLRRVQGESPTWKRIRVGELVIDLNAHWVEASGRPVHLTPTEFGLLRALAEQPGHALTRLEMIEKGLGYGYEGVERTVDSHIKNLRRKLSEAGGKASLVETVFGVGYRLAAGERS
jgi:two-component system alkaline phosphatase synthesis response regulator PhoP